MVASRGVAVPLIAVVGATGTGKTALSLALARQFNGEIIAADSRTLYKGMNIGTAKPTLKEQAAIKHYLIDITSPDTPITVAQFKHLANDAIMTIAKRGKVPFLVGGSGLYIDSVLFDYQFSVPPDPFLRERLGRLSVEELQTALLEQGIPLPENKKNPRYLIRTLETGGTEKQTRLLRDNTLVIGLHVEQDMLYNRISRRVDAMVSAGFVEEVRKLAETYGWDNEPMRAPGYKAFREYIEGAVSLDEAKAAFIKNDLQLAKRQRTWFRRNKDIHWVETRDETVDLITTFLNK